MPFARCLDCGESFHREPGERWKTLCYGCWLERNPTRNKKRAHRNPPESEQSESDTTVLVVNAEMLRLLIYLCHPDKHSGSNASTRATQWLLEQREK